MLHPQDVTVLMPKSHVRKPKKAAAERARTERRAELKRLLAKQRRGESLSKREADYRKWAVNLEIDIFEAKEDPAAFDYVTRALLRRLRSGEQLTAEELDLIDRALDIDA